MNRSRLLSAAALVCTLCLLAPPATSAGQHRAADAPRSTSAAFAPLANLQQLFSSLWKSATTALGSMVPAAASTDGNPTVMTGDEGSALDPHG